MGSAKKKMKNIVRVRRTRRSGVGWLDTHWRKIFQAGFVFRVMSQLCKFVACDMTRYNKHGMPELDSGEILRFMTTDLSEIVDNLGIIFSRRPEDYISKG